MTAKSSGVTATERMLAEFCGDGRETRRGGRKRAGEAVVGANSGAVMLICKSMSKPGWPADGRCPG